jgi:hypothetical protein
MRQHDRWLQRLVDGELSRQEAAGLARLQQERPELADQERRLRDLAVLMRLESARAPHAHEELRSAILLRLPARPPRAEARVRPLDLAYAGLVIGLIAATFAVVKVVADQAMLLAILAVISLMAGTGLLLMAGWLRQTEAGMLSKLLRRPVAIGPGDVLVYRAVGLALAVGGLWLAYSG